MSLRSVVAAAVYATAAVCLTVSNAGAQSATPLDRFDPAPAGDVFAFVPSADVAGGLRPAAALALSFAKSPLVLAVPELPDPEVGNVVAHQLVLHGMISFELLHRLKLELDVPVTLEQDGASPSGGGLDTSSPSGAAMNDLRAGARVMLLAQQRWWPAISVSLTGWFPTGDDTAFTSSGYVRLAPALVFGADYDDFVWSSTVGRRFDTGDENSLLGHELLFGVAAGPRFGPLLLSAELWGTTVSQSGTTAFSQATTNAEVHLAARYQLGPFAFRLAGGPGLTPGVGTPDYRFVATIGYASAAPNAWARQRQEERMDAALFAKPPPPPTTHAAPVAKPEPTRPDADGDGVADRDDACPRVAGARDPDPKRDGCPPDGDGDGVADAVDACPTEKGQPDPDPKKNGCAGAVRVVGEQIVILEKVAFETGEANIKRESEAVLEQLAAVLRANPDIVRVAIEGHTDDVGNERRNIRLSQQRALAVMRWLIDHGIDERRLEASGYGPRQPLTSNDTDEGRAKNRRVDFRILQRDARGEAAWTDGEVR